MSKRFYPKRGGSWLRRGEFLKRVRAYAINYKRRERIQKENEKKLETYTAMFNGTYKVPRRGTRLRPIAY